MARPLVGRFLENLSVIAQFRVSNGNTAPRSSAVGGSGRQSLVGGAVVQGDELQEGDRPGYPLMPGFDPIAADLRRAESAIGVLLGMIRIYCEISVGRRI